MEVAEAPLYDGARLAFEAARGAGLLGQFLVFEQPGLRAVLTTAPELSYFNVVAGVSAEALAGVPEVLETYDSIWAATPSLVVARKDAAVHDQLREGGFVPAGRRPVACIDLPLGSARTGEDPPDQRTVCEAHGGRDLDLFLEVLSAGSGGPAAVRGFMAAEHSADTMLRFVGWHHDQPVAAAATSVNRGVAVLGGAAVVADERARGWQLVLVRHRLLFAQTAGCFAAVATAAPDSVSRNNLARAGFTIHNRQGWRSIRR